MRPKFLADANVGKLAKWLRILGYDALYLADGEDGALVQRALREGRVLLTKDTHLLQRRVIARGQVRAVLVQGDDVLTQLSHLARDLGLDTARAFSLCVPCGVALRDRPKETLERLVPPYVFQHQERFMECPACGKLYWHGTHWRRMQDVTRRLGLQPAQASPKNGDH